MEIVLRAAVIFVFLWVLTRAVGKKELSELSAFELVLIVVIGDLVQQGVTQEDMSVTGAILAVGTIALLVVATSYISFRWTRTAPVVEGIAVLVVDEGRVLDEVLTIERLTREDVVSAARQQGIGDLADVRFGVLEPDGAFAFVRRDDLHQTPPHKAGGAL